MLRKRFLKPGSIGFIPTGGYSGIVNYKYKSLMCFFLQGIDVLGKQDAAHSQSTGVDVASNLPGDKDRVQISRLLLTRSYMQTLP